MAEASGHRIRKSCGFPDVLLWVHPTSTSLTPSKAAIAARSWTPLRRDRLESGRHTGGLLPTHTSTTCRATDTRCLLVRCRFKRDLHLQLRSAVEPNANEARLVSQHNVRHLLRRLTVETSSMARGPPGDMPFSLICRNTRYQRHPRGLITPLREYPAPDSSTETAGRQRARRLRPRRELRGARPPCRLPST